MLQVLAIGLYGLKTKNELVDIVVNITTEACALNCLQVAKTNIVNYAGFKQHHTFISECKLQLCWLKINVFNLNVTTAIFSTISQLFGDKFSNFLIILTDIGELPTYGYV